MNDDLKAIKKTKGLDPIDAAIKEFEHSIRDAEECAELYGQYGNRVDRKRRRTCWAKLNSVIDALQEAGAGSRGDLLDELDRWARNLSRVALSRMPARLMQDLFVGIFATYDEFLGNLLFALFVKKPTIFKGISGDVPAAEILECESLADLNNKMLWKYIDSLRRKSYDDQFASLEGLFGLKLRDFDGWKRFIEASQRRHLFTHCGGRVSRQYIDACKAVSFEFPGAAVEGGICWSSRSTTSLRAVRL